MSQDFYRNDLEPSVVRSEVEILTIVRSVVPTAELRRTGPTGHDTPSWSCWITTVTDEERDRVRNNDALMARLALATTEFPPDSFTVQSRETVDRDYKGSWFYAMR
jgi:hypothetical protein